VGRTLTWGGGIAVTAMIAIGAASACGSRSALRVLDTERSRKHCAQFDATADLAELNVFLLIDSSGSMDDLTKLGIRKWDAMTDAMEEFLFDPNSDGIRVGLTFLPQIHDEVPRYCVNSDKCSSPGSCRPLGLCRPSEAGICQSNQQCFVAGDYCDRLGQCAMSLEVFCHLDQGSCGALGECEPAGFCENRSGCSADDYAIGGLQLLPEQASDILFQLDGRELEGYTPTLPALTGVVTSAAQWASTNPREKSVVVLATDGMPTACDVTLAIEGIPGAINNLVGIAAFGAARSIDTFVIGVFSPEEEVHVAHNLDAVAAAGGTNKAFLITTDKEVSQELVRALHEVRLANLCEYALPPYDDDLDLTQLQVRIDPAAGGESIWLEYRESAAACDPTDGGFYFDRDPDGPLPPGRIILCPSICELGLEAGSISVSCTNQGESGTASQ